MKKMVASLLFLAAALLSGYSHAQSVGRYTCNECALTGPAPDFETAMFIRTVVNLDVDTWWNSSTQRGKTVTICNSSICAVYKYFAGGNFIQAATAPRVGSNGSGNGGSGGGGGTGSVRYRPIYRTTTVCVSGYCESHTFIVGFEVIYGPKDNMQ